MEYRNLEITVCSAKDLKDVNMFSKMDVYVVVMIAEDPRTKQKTPVDRDGGKSPKWNHKMKFVVHEAAAKQNRLTLVFQIKSDRALGDRDIGEISVPVKELLDSDGDGEVDQPMKTERIASYSVRTPSGKTKGTLDFSYKIGEKVDAPAVSEYGGASNYSEKKYGDEPVMAYPSYGYQAPPHGAAPMYPPPQQGAGHMYPPPQQGAGYPPQVAGYPPAGYSGGHGYPQMAPGYGGYPPQQGAGYGYPAQMAQKPKKKKGGMGMGLGLGAGLLGGLLIGDMVSDIGDASYDGGFDDSMGGFDF